MNEADCRRISQIGAECLSDVNWALRISLALLDEEREETVALRAKVQELEAKLTARDAQAREDDIRIRSLRADGSTDTLIEEYYKIHQDTFDDQWILRVCAIIDKALAEKQVAIDDKQVLFRAEMSCYEWDLLYYKRRIRCIFETTAKAACAKADKYIAELKVDCERALKGDSA
jgi:hypothetical protein